MNMANHESHRAADGQTHEHITSCRSWSSPAKRIAVQTRAHTGWTCWSQTRECWRLDSMVLLLRHLQQMEPSKTKDPLTFHIQSHGYVSLYMCERNSTMVR